MALLIRQGKQDTSKDGKFDVLVEKGVIAAITGVKLCDPSKFPDTIEVEFKIIQSEKYNGRKFWDRVSYSPTSNFSWKYRSLRKSAGCPYQENESETIDIEGMLVGSAVMVDLGSRTGKDKEGNEREYQSITYKEFPKNAETSAPVEDSYNPFEETTNSDSQSKPAVNTAQEYMPADLADEKDFT